MNETLREEAIRIIDELIIDIQKLERIDDKVSELENKLKDIKELLCDIDGIRYDVNLLKSLIDIKKERRYD